MINMKVRFRNKTFLMLFIPALMAFIYTVLGYTGIVPKISEDEMVNLLIMLVEILSMLGIVNDPTTKGMQDSTRALFYEEPYEEGCIDTQEEYDSYSMNKDTLWIYPEESDSDYTEGADEDDE